jgi:hypothetical protein
MYKTACLAFAGLAMLLITGAIWANDRGDVRGDSTRRRPELSSHG